MGFFGVAIGSAKRISGRTINLFRSDEVRAKSPWTSVRGLVKLYKKSVSVAERAYLREEVIENISNRIVDIDFYDQKCPKPSVGPLNVSDDLKIWNCSYKIAAKSLSRLPKDLFEAAITMAKSMYIDYDGFVYGKNGIQKIILSSLYNPELMPAVEINITLFDETRLNPPGMAKSSPDYISVSNRYVSWAITALRDLSLSKEYHINFKQILGGHIVKDYFIRKNEVLLLTKLAKIGSIAYVWGEIESLVHGIKWYSEHGR